MCLKEKGVKKGNEFSKENHGCEVCNLWNI